jgi:uncharacterized membrane protein
MFGDMAILAFFLAQAFDGVFTYLGVQTLGYGPSIEGNPLLAFGMTSVGVGATLAIAKATAAGFGALLHIISVHRVVAALAVLYYAAAVVPWTRILFFG